jgi:hypothetical protein
MPEQTSPKSLRRRLGLSVRGLMVLVLILGGVPGWILYRARVQREAVAAIRRAGGSVGYDSDWSNPTAPAGSASRRSPWSPKWLVDRLGTDLLLNAVSVHVPQGASDSELVHAGCLTRLESLVVHPSTVTDAGLVHLRELTSLSILSLAGTRVSDAGLAHLKGLTKLKTLLITGVDFSDSIVEELNKAIPMLEVVR